MLKRNKTTAKYISEHAQDAFTDLGYDYRGNIFKRSISPIILNNENNSKMLGEIDKMIVMLVDTVKQIKLQYMISLNKNDRNVN